jgi:hypothetical protein
MKKNQNQKSCDTAPLSAWNKDRYRRSHFFKVRMALPSQTFKRQDHHLLHTPERRNIKIQYCRVRGDLLREFGGGKY